MRDKQSLQRQAKKSGGGGGRRNAGAENRGESKREAGEYTHGGPICLK